MDCFTAIFEQLMLMFPAVHIFIKCLNYLFLFNLKVLCFVILAGLYKHPEKFNYRILITMKKQRFFHGFKI